MRRRDKADWHFLKLEIETALRQLDTFPNSVRVDGKIRRLEMGLNQENYLFWLTAEEPLPYPPSHGYILRKCRRDCEDTSYTQGIVRLQHEASTIEALASQRLDFSVPEFICFVGDHNLPHDGFVETALPGLCLDDLKRNPDKRSFIIEAIARVASAVHKLPVDRFRYLDGHPDVKTHVEARRDKLSTESLADDADASRALKWIDAHLHGDRPSVVLHGDLLPQNILWDWDKERLGVIDWEFAQIGDPAYDLAIVTRGNAKLCRVQDGLKRLVDTYREAGGASVTPADVITHELLLMLNWFASAVRGEREGKHEGYPPEHYRKKIRSILRRAESF